MEHQGVKADRTPEERGRISSTRLPHGERVETWSIPTVVAEQRIDRLFLRDATLSSDHRSIIRSTIAGIEGSGGPISMNWQESTERKGGDMLGG